MKRILLSASILCAGAFASSAVLAESRTDKPFGVTLGASTLGVTLEPSWRLDDNFGMRMPIGTGSFDFSADSNGYDYDGTVDSLGLGLMGDYYPFAGGFRLSAGAFYTDYEVSLDGDDVTYQGITGDIRAKAEQKRNVMPALAVGYDGRLGNTGTLSMSVGGMFGSGFDVSATESTGLLTQAEINEEISDIRKDLGGLDVIPYVQIAIGFRF